MTIGGRHAAGGPVVRTGDTSLLLRAEALGSSPEGFFVSGVARPAGPPGRLGPLA